jgi:hypothetical protein
MFDREGLGKIRYVRSGQVMARWDGMGQIVIWLGGIRRDLAYCDEIRSGTVWYDKL